ncbi:KilA-N domain-containing protein [uncultured Chryseobacterium sp.]|uniref:KilA-N domain-containing protein n=1 Tax=uncultured Chryseobacterium sp. TaxID=259322 RepID=UPI00258DA2D1|nr:KilA-N domain-containing protein [uncultured Chryseobacterium sp.]
MAKNNKLKVQEIEISLTKVNSEDYICLTDMIKAKDGDFFVSDWLRNANTLDYIYAWESLNNPNFNYGEFAIIRNGAGSNSHKVSVKDLIEKANCIGIIAKTGRYGGTYAHTDIAFNFGMWISPIFQLYIVKEYQRLKEIETNQYGLEWNVKRILSKANYQIHTDAVKNYIIPDLTYTQKKEWVYAEEADLLNIVLFGCTAKQWREANPQRVLNGENIRDMASINDLAILTNLESMNASLIKSRISKKERFRILLDMVKDQREILSKTDYLKNIKKISNSIFVDQKKENLHLSDFDQKLKKGLGFDPNSEK